MRTVNVSPIGGTRYSKIIIQDRGSSTTVYDQIKGGANDSFLIGRQLVHDSILNQGITMGAWLRFDESQLNVLEPVAAQTGTAAVTIKIESTANVVFKVAVMSQSEPDGDQAGYNALMAISSAYTIPAGSEAVTLNLTNAELGQMKQYGIGIIPTTEASPAAYSAQYTTTVVPSRQTAVCTLSNLASPGVITPVNPASHGYIVAGASTVITYRYDQESGANMAYLGIRYTNLGTGETAQLTRKSSVSIASGGTGTYTIPANTLTEGTYRFEFSGMPSAATSYYADSSDIWLTGSEAEYIVRVNPSTSAITCDGKPVPTVSWTSTSQAAYQVRFGDYDSSVRAGSQTSFTVPRLFADGNYPAQVRTATATGEWSAWTDVEYVAISNSAPSGTVTTSAENFGSNVRIKWASTVTSPTNYAVFRDGTLIGVTAGTEFVDRYASVGTYKVCAVKNGNYRASNDVAFQSSLQYDVISGDGGLTYTSLKYTRDMKSQSESHKTEVSFAWFAGRRKPIAVTANKKTLVKQFSYIFRRRADAEFLTELEGQEVILKNTRGAVIYGILSGLTLSDERCPVASFSVQEIEWEGENVEYHV